MTAQLIHKKIQLEHKMNALMHNPVMVTTAEQRPAEDQAEVSQLLSKMAAGCSRSFNELHVRYRSMVYAIALQVLRNHEDAEDTTQEIFSQLWNRSSQYSDQKGRLASWLSTLAKNRAIDKLRGRERRGKLNNGFEKETLLEKGWQAPKPDEMANLSEMGAYARSAVQTLTDEQREAILMAYFEGLTQQEISARIGTPLGTVKARIRRGLSRLRTLVRE
jgi:RNA polymerase sigma-70 factor, ECF subfamily